jgi:aspartyl-tRNA(Asn)/glutamyl-tRNA(Gln) amidotransferase subunit A
MTTINDDIALASVEDAAAEVKAKRLSPVELTDALLDRIERLNPRLNAYMTVTAEQARAAARSAADEIARGEYRGPLHGIPIAHKDLFETAGVRTTAGSMILTDNIPSRDAAVVESLAAAGAVSLGKLGMHEWAYGTTSDNVHFGAIHNPWDLDHVPGGSSGGSGAAVAAGLAFVATGSDTGGSIRMPAAACGCVGLMPTYGRVSLRGAIPLSWTLDHAGPLTRTVRDAAIALQAMAGHDPRDPHSVDVPVPDYTEGIERGAQGLRVGVPRAFFAGSLEPDVERLTNAAFNGLSNAGADVRDVDGARLRAYQAIFGPVTFAEAAAVHEATYPARKDEYGPQVAGLLDLGLRTTSVQLAKAQQALAIARAGEADEMLDGLDVLALPTMPIAAPSINGARSDNRAGAMIAFTAVFDVAGQPAIAVPCGLTDAGLPASLTLVARRWDEQTLLRAARAYEQVRGPFPAPPIS